MEFQKMFEEVCIKYNKKVSIVYMKDDGTKVSYRYDDLLSEAKLAKKFI